MDKLHYKFTYPKALEGLVENCKTYQELDLKLTEIANTEPNKFEYIVGDVETVEENEETIDIIFHNRLVDKGSYIVKEFFEPCED